MSTVTESRTAGKFRTMADGLQDKIDKLRAPRLDNTPKRQCQARSAYIESCKQERVQRALRALADCHDAGNVPPLLAGITTKAAIEPLVSRRIDHPSYYVIIETSKYSLSTPQALAMQQLLESSRSAVDLEAMQAHQEQERIAEMERKVKFACIPSFFPTPQPLIEMMLERAMIVGGNSVLEPSAGKGDILEAIRDCELSGVSLSYCEINYTLREILAAKGFGEPLADDFLKLTIEADFDRIVMNPPFENLQDVEHVYHAYYRLKPGGRLVSLMSPSAFFRSNKRAADFREWFGGVGGQVEDVAAGSFKSAFVQTGVASKLITIVRD